MTATKEKTKPRKPATPAPEKTAPESQAETTPAPAPDPQETQAPPKVPVIEVLAPTLNRPKEARRLEAALEGVNVPAGYVLRVTIQRETEPRALTAIVNEMVARSDAEIVVVLADHIVPDKDFLVHVAIAFEDRFPDLDGLVGLKIANMDPLPGVREYCFFAAGRKFIERFPDAQLFCPDYYHFYADTELGRGANEAGAFYFAEEARINTFQVNNGRADIDATWRASRSRKKEDDAQNARRRENGLLWGRTFDRVNP